MIYDTTTTSIKGDSYTVSATEGLTRSSSSNSSNSNSNTSSTSSDSAILPSSTFINAAAGRREGFVFWGGPLMIISLLAGYYIFWGNRGDWGLGSGTFN